MKLERARKYLESADKTLAGLTDGLIKAGEELRQSPVLLASALQQIQAAHDEIGSEPPDDSVKALVGSIRARTARVQVLLDSAAAFYGGSLAPPPSTTGSYTVDGRVDAAELQRRFHFEV